ncbi:epimerase family protein SDR39U1 homolog, chloroplastic isoform X3 [Amborella trichopoda]|uniref:epimerase family protein SDR39U1 homolog, chloroplastic isoform X3 n=1 Tax=Amborella trichopoda TaxID=13333 RepID=UPI0009C0524A|nr:epimerase family protein SDR39U1 homolog, chloroplastic isoform X3 [Amborella trichopoda]|eukprot:XP_020529486.1 epimerase family protein SDR39U1 homolog, chloroplastic isoform X3 [Amborella trichopoda]
MLWLTELAQQTDTSPASKPDMELCKISPHWTKTSPSLFHLRRPRLIKEEKRCRIFCVDNNQSLKSEQLIVSITGATGFIGRRLVQRLLAAKEFPGIIIVEEPEWPKCIEASSAVVNLAGLPISTRWSAEIKKEIKRSRVNTTTKVVDVINCLSPDVQPKVLVSATAVGYYGTSETQVFDEQSPSGNDFLAEVCREWEARAQGVNKDVRLVLIRIGVVLGKDGGALARMIPLFMMFAGGPLGSGKQWFSWIHLDDLVSLIMEALSNQSYKGVINGTAPNPVRLGEMCEQLGRVMGRPSWLPVPDFALKAVLGEGASVVLDGQKVLPKKAQELGFSFDYPYVSDALKDIITSDKKLVQGQVRAP